MGNLGKREKYYLMLLGIVVVVLLIYYFGIRNLGIKHDELVAQRADLQAQLDYYEALKSQNEQALAQINQLKADITDIEGRFLPYICSEAIEQYVLKTFEDAGCPYLVSVGVEDVAMEAVTMPDGSAPTERLLVSRISVQYSTTDGYNIPEYNRSASVVDHGVIDDAAWNAYLDEMYWHGSGSIVGYNEFINALETIEAENEDCIKISKIGITAEGGYILLNADIDFYSATFASRVSDPNTNAPYITWAGSTNIDTVGGIIGRPFVFDNPASEWFGVMMSDAEAQEGSRPFSTYYSDAIFEAAVNTQGLENVLDVGAAPVPDEVPED